MLNASPFTISTRLWAAVRDAGDREAGGGDEGRRLGLLSVSFPPPQPAPH